MGELFVHPLEIEPLVTERLFDFVRVHVSTYGGITPALRLAHLCATFGVRTAFHGPRDVSPIGMAANVHLDVHLENFGIQEWAFRAPEEEELFPGTPQVRAGAVDVNERPGWGIEMDERLAARFPCDDTASRRPVPRLADGTSRPY